MTICMYKTESDYFYAVEIGMPESPVRFGEGDSPENAVKNLEMTQYQSADFSCRAPSNKGLARYFDLGLDEDEQIIDCTPEEESAAEDAYEALQD